MEKKCKVSLGKRRDEKLAFQQLSISFDRLYAIWRQESCCKQVFESHGENISGRSARDGEHRDVPRMISVVFQRRPANSSVSIVRSCIRADSFIYQGIYQDLAPASRPSITHYFFFVQDKPHHVHSKAFKNRGFRVTFWYFYNRQLIRKLKKSDKVTFVLTYKKISWSAHSKKCLEIYYTILWTFFCFNYRYIRLNSPIT